MKTLRLIIIATFISFTMVSVGNVINLYHGVQTVKIVEITLEEAVQDPGLVSAMYQQLNAGYFLTGSYQQTYTLDVYYMNYTLRITGSLSQWKLFFRSATL